ncbi:MAG: N-acetylmuramoyl-L-alanine amidase [Alphaproteobacteria bacterium]|nr:N-acetylmuramoyl-L-alanine amidase [Alphaproteobacteria bacterium]MDA8006084.1 N-acetylmuramoyl-L-alanine amidase [Alphaproteobacteria bacterium]MDA8013211.1 N-acetylmuramoyl-L-alanine amidase [Alphaproteobacteria bacterium]
MARFSSFNFLRAAPAGGSGCRQQERLSRRAHRPLSLVEKFAPSGLFMARPLALVGDASLTVNGSRSSEPHPLMPAGAARKKIKLVSLIKRQTTITAFVVLFSIIFNPLPAHGDEKPVTVNALRFGWHETNIRFVIELSHPVPWRVSTLDNPHRVVIDLPVVSWNNTSDTGLGFVSALRYGRFSHTRSRIVLDLAAPAVPHAAFTLPHNNHGQRLVIDMTPVNAAAFPQNFSEAFRSSADLPDDSAAATPPAPAPDKKLWTVVIDPGHGGIDPGAISPSGIHEKDLVLEYALVFADALNQIDGFRAVLTRDDNRYIPLRERVRLAEAAESDMFISLHFNTNPSRDVRGASVYTLSETASDKEGALLAARENKSDVLAGVDLEEHPNAVSRILIDLSQRDSINASRDYAEILVRELRSRDTRTLRKATRSAGFAVLKSPNMPSVLLELGHLSNPEEERFVRSARGRDEIIRALVASVREFAARRGGRPE